MDFIKATSNFINLLELIFTGQIKEFRDVLGLNWDNLNQSIHSLQMCIFLLAILIGRHITFNTYFLFVPI